MTLVELLIASSAAIVVLGATLALLESGQRIQQRDAEWGYHHAARPRRPCAHGPRDPPGVRGRRSKANAIVFRATIGGKAWRIEYECSSKQSGTTYTQCVRLATEGESLPATGIPIATDLLDGSEVFSYSPSTGSPTMATVKPTPKS